MADDLRLYVIDDEPDFCRFLCTAAEGLGYETRYATEAEDFKDNYESFQPSVIFLDLVIPEIDGFEILKWLADAKCTAKIIVMTGYDSLYSDMAMSMGQANNLRITSATKPIRMATLRRLLDPVQLSQDQDG